MTVGVIKRDFTKIITSAIEKHGASREALIPILSEINRSYGYIPAEAFPEIKKQLHQTDSQVRVSESQLLSLASFYHMLSTKALGRHVIRFCESAPCHVMGGRELFKTLNSELKLQPGETSLDRKWSFITTSCLGICGVGPVLMVDEDVYGNVRPEEVAQILARYD